MYELALLVIIIAAVVWLIRPRKPTLDSPIIIDNPNFHATLAPQLTCVYGHLPFCKQLVLMVLGATASVYPASQ